MSPNTATTAARGAVATVAVACSLSLSRCELAGASMVLGVKEKDEEGDREGSGARVQMAEGKRPPSLSY